LASSRVLPRRAWPRCPHGHDAPSQPHLPLLTALTLPLAVTSREAENYLAAIEKINLAHAKRPGTTTESELGKAIPRSTVVGLALLLKEKPTLEVSQALVTCGKVALDLAPLNHFQRIRKRLLEIDQDAAGRLGDATVRERFLVRKISARTRGTSSANWL
jgi:hypothetical protein